MKLPEEWIEEEGLIGFEGLRTSTIRAIQQDAIESYIKCQQPVDLEAKAGWQVEIQHELGFANKYKLYVHDQLGNTRVRVCKLEDDQFNIGALL